MMRRLFTHSIAAPACLAVVLIAAAATPGSAQTPASPPIAAPAAIPGSAPPALPPVSPEAHKEAQALTEMIGVSRQSQQLIAIMRSQMVQLVMRSGGKPQDEAAKIVDEVMMPDFVADQATLTNEIIDVWAHNFTLDDIKALRAFYATPLGQKLIATLPNVTQQGMQAGQVWGQKVYQASITKHRVELEARGMKF